VLLSSLLSTWMSFRFWMAFCYLFRSTFLRVFNLLFWMLTTWLFVTHEQTSLLGKDTSSLIKHSVTQSNYDDFYFQGSMISFSSPILNDTLTLTEVSVLNGNIESVARFKGR
jgi:hypothetical protein